MKNIVMKMFCTLLNEDNYVNIDADKKTEIVPYDME